MKVLFVTAHPNLESFNYVMLESMVSGLESVGHEVKIKDLYVEDFDPVLKAEDLSVLQTGEIPKRIQIEQDKLLWADSLIFLYPLWWFDRPAILKGWFDVVLTNQVAFSYGKEGVKGLLKHKKALVIITAGSSEGYFKEMDAMSLIYRPVTDGTLGFCGIDDVQHKIYFEVPNLNDDGRQAILDEMRLMGREF